MANVRNISYSVCMSSIPAYYKLTAISLIKAHKHELVRYINIPLEQKPPRSYFLRFCYMCRIYKVWTK